jgi:hypothetical protein
MFHLRSSIVALALLAVSGIASAQAPESSKPEPAGTKTANNVERGRRSLFGVWGPVRDEFKKYIPPQASRVITNSNHTVSSQPEPPLTPWAKENLVIKEGISHGPNQIPSGRFTGQNCEPIGAPAQYTYTRLYPFELVEASNRIVQFFEYHREWREIWMDGRGHPQDLDPTYMGHSIGRWEGDTLVVDTVGFNGKTWIDQNLDHFLSDAARMEERFRRLDHDILQIDITLYDPKAWGEGKSWPGLVRAYQFYPDGELQEFYCTLEEDTRFDRKVLEDLTEDKK